MVSPRFLGPKIFIICSPADQFITTTVKARVCRGWDAWVEDIFARNCNDTAIAEISVSHMPTLQKRKYALLAGAIKDLPVDSIVRSWDGATHMGFPVLCVASWQGRMTPPLLRHQNITKKK